MTLDTLAQQPPTIPSRRWRRAASRIDLIFWVTVALPTLVAALYYGLIASDVYISESRFVVRSPQRASQTGIGALLQGTVFARSQDDTYSVHDFISSRDALTELDTKLKLRSAFSKSDISVFNRFPGLGWDESFEAFYRYYLRHVEISYDTASSITVLRVRAYGAKDAQNINRSLLEMSEHLVNNMNMRSRKDLIQVAEQEVKAAEVRSKEAAAALSGFRADRSVFDPDRQSALQLEGVARLREELLTAEAQLAEVQLVSPQNPQVTTLQSRVKALRKAVADDDARVLGKQGGLSAKAPAYDRLILEKTFADRQLASALSGLDSARNELARKQLYLETLVRPNLPDDALEPRRLRSILTVLALSLIFWGVCTLVLASIREHTD